MKLRNAVALAVLLAATIVAAPAQADGIVGVRRLEVHAPERSQASNVTLWYPAAAATSPIAVGDTAVFQGAVGHESVPVADGRFPVVLLAHGGMRAAPNLGGWIGAGLAARGFVVAVVEAPRLGPADAPAAIAELWRRPADLSATLTALVGDPALSGRIDPSRVGAVGVLLGGTSVLSLVGARFDETRYGRSCDAGGTNMDCAWFAEGGVDLRQADMASLTRSNLDPRIDVAVAVDPELSASFSAASLADVIAPVVVVNLGAPETIAPGLDASHLAEAVLALRYVALPAAGPFDSFPTCNAGGAAIVAEEGGPEAICGDGDGDGRERVHEALAELIAAALIQHLPSGP